LLKRDVRDTICFVNLDPDQVFITGILDVVAAIVREYRCVAARD
jgi:hypothetical protein